MKKVLSTKRAIIIALASVFILIAAFAAFCLTSDSFRNNPVVASVRSVLDPAKSLSQKLSGTTVTATGTESAYISPVGISITSDNFAFVADETSKSVYKIDLSSNTKVGTYSVGQKVNAITCDTTNVYVMFGELNGKVAKLDKNLNLVKEVEVGHTPSYGVINAGTLYVANRYNNNVSAVTTSSMTKTKDIAVSREPISMTLVGTNLFVACHLQDGSMKSSTVASKVSVIDTTTNTKTKDIQLINGSEGVKDICSSTDGKYVYVSHLIARYAYSTTQLDRGWINTNAITIIDASAKTVLNTVLLDEVELGAGNPWGVATAGDKLVVSISGTNEAIIIDTTKMMAKINAVTAGTGVVSKASDIPNYLNFLDGTRTRIKLSGTNPREVAIANNKAYFVQYFTGNIGVLDLSSSAVSSISLGTQPTETVVRRGETLWYDATKCYQQWESCASCHPDVRMDSINWDNLNDGLGNPKNVKSMLYSHRTPPAMITGIRANAETAVRAGMKYIQFNTISEDENVAIDEFLKSLRPVASPYLNKDGTLTASAEAGKALFNAENSCATCHPGPLFTDFKTHDSKTIATDG
ncbi:MAG: PQQ-dependent catabolism-associated beta-propeller protein, partial [Oscillospiraceae bacterium]|nr:PQQ-dependent catabolism-associated beta-propeller protein [Oscillospiraceae bacterium]